MPLSKVRDKERKQLAKQARLELSAFQPKVKVMVNGVYKMVDRTEIDADGNPIPDIT